MKLYITPPSIITLMTWVPQRRVAFGHSAHRLAAGSYDRPCGPTRTIFWLSLAHCLIVRPDAYISKFSYRAVVINILIDYFFSNFFNNFFSMFFSDLLSLSTFWELVWVIFFCKMFIYFTFFKFTTFHWIGPLGQFGLVVAMSTVGYICPLGWVFFNLRAYVQEICYKISK